MADDDAGEGGGGEEFFEPLDAGQVEVVGGLVEEEDVGLLGEGEGDGEAFFPAAGVGLGDGVEVLESGAAEGFGGAAFPLGLVDVVLLEGLVDDFAGGDVGGNSELCST